MSTIAPLVWRQKGGHHGGRSGGSRHRRIDSAAVADSLIAQFDWRTAYASSAAWFFSLSFYPPSF